MFQVLGNDLIHSLENLIQEKASQWTWALHLHQEAASETL